MMAVTPVGVPTAGGVSPELQRRPQGPPAPRSLPEPGLALGRLRPRRHQGREGLVPGQLPRGRDRVGGELAEWELDLVQARSLGVGQDRHAQGLRGRAESGRACHDRRPPQPSSAR